ncbi:Rrf2 family transcriptional regulator [Phreatobacter aquaticus]|uniref:Rrf2 family transcriptional regulator n=1 Tax=Phreatobacter aquaticus TaxID=2570229 RepID=A0A4D7QK27_9HYPH|nr:Rrf2 family transcriptional regulator [Phreatobacter aquaticus]QCK85714.1 Rrf2 family transcriptional regulator [Phreatobacter aquaticus]
MPILSRRGRLAIAAVVDIAVYGENSPVAAKALAERHDLPPRHLEPMLQELVRAGILKGLRGPRGGYNISREHITCGEIVRAAAGNAEDDARSTSALIKSVILPTVKRAEALYFAELDKITVTDLCNEAKNRQLVLAD